MLGADALIQTLVGSQVDTCFANPGTSEMQFVAALDRTPAMRPVLCLFEGVAGGAADGYGRMADRPACTLLHLGPGYGNALAQLHNARRAYTPIVNIVGDHATYHRAYDAPLNSDIKTIVRPNSLWVASADHADEVAALTAEAVTQSLGPPGGPVSLILPADAAWSPTARPLATARASIRPPPSGETIETIARAVRAARRVVILLGGAACRDRALAQAARLKAAGLQVMADTFVARQSRGAGVFAPSRMPYYGEAALAALEGADLMVLVGTAAPVAFFAYPNRPSVLVPEGCRTLTLATRSEDPVAGLTALADALGAPREGPSNGLSRPDSAPVGRLTPQTCGASIARHAPEGAIFCDDAVTSGAGVAGACATAAPHEVLALTGGAIGAAMPLALGAAVACPDRKVLALTGDGAGMYSIQALWTMARENLDVTIVVFSNHSYRVLHIEMERTGGGQAGPSARSLLDLGDPRIDWVSIARGMGVEARKCETAEAFDKAFQEAMSVRGPHLIEALI